MTDKGTSKSIAFWLQIFSLTALILLPLIVLRTMIDPPSLSTNTQLVGLVFTIICLLGAIVGVRPSSFSRSNRKKSTQTRSDNSQGYETLKQKPALQGHHHSCDHFSDHVLKIRNKVFCAGCTGLTTGAVISIYGGILYFFFANSLIDALLIFWIGFAGAFIGIIQHQLYRALSVRSGFIRYILNVVFVVGAFFILVGTNQLVGNFAVDIYVLCVILLWIINRIMMSGSEHDRICVQCGVESCRHL
ncbi:MAG: hypothetical protein ACW98U_08495 [Candidatus Thorarchaeota archaeon]|jgi:hypothetical protein